jgi:RNA processing factor Prp31
MRTRCNASSVDLSDILPEEVEEEVKRAAEISMGSDISGEGTLRFVSVEYGFTFFNRY